MQGGLALDGNLETVGADWKQGPVAPMTHGTLVHGRMAIMSTTNALRHTTPAVSSSIVAVAACSSDIL